MLGLDFDLLILLSVVSAITSWKDSKVLRLFRFNRHFRCIQLDTLRPVFKPLRPVKLGTQIRRQQFCSNYIEPTVLRCPGPSLTLY